MNDTYYLDPTDPDCDEMTIRSGRKGAELGDPVHSGSPKRCIDTVTSPWECVCCSNENCMYHM